MTKPALQIENFRSHRQTAGGNKLSEALNNLNVSQENEFKASALLVQSWIIEVHSACYAVDKPPKQSAWQSI